MRNSNDAESLLSFAAERVLGYSLNFTYQDVLENNGAFYLNNVLMLLPSAHAKAWAVGDSQAKLEKKLAALKTDEIYFLRTGVNKGAQDWKLLCFVEDQGWFSYSPDEKEANCDQITDIQNRLTQKGKASLINEQVTWGVDDKDHSFYLVTASRENIIRAANYLWDYKCLGNQKALINFFNTQNNEVNLNSQIQVSPVQAPERIPEIPVSSVRQNTKEEPEPLQKAGILPRRIARAYEEKGCGGHLMISILDYFCCEPLYKGHDWASQKSLIPFTYHARRKENGDRVDIQHYTATFVWTAFISFVVATAFYFSNFKHLEDKEHTLFNRLDHLGHQLFAVVALIGLSFALGAIAGAIHYGVNCLRGKENHSDLASDTDHALVDLGPRVTINNAKQDTEKASLLGYDKNGAAIHRIGSCHPFRLIYPLAPMKSFLWVTTLSAIGFALGSLMDSAFFNALAGSTPLSNGTFTNCTVGNKTVLSNAGCVEDFTHFGSVVTLGVASALAIGGAATLFHCILAKKTNCCGEHAEQEYYLIDKEATNKIF